MSYKEIQIEGKKIGENSPIFLIAEAGVNHNGKVKIAKKLIDIAIEAHVDAIKFQTYITENLILKATPKVEYQKTSIEDDEDFYDMIKKYELTKEDFKNLKNYCTKKGIIFLSTPLDISSVEFLDSLTVSAYKIGSGDMNNFPLLKKICEKGKPILLSTGMATLDEVKESVNFIISNKIRDLVIFQCTTNYPSLLDEINLNVIDTYKKEFPNNIIGFSDHSLGIITSIGAAVKGVKVIERHFTLDKKMNGPDHKASLDPEELTEWVNNIRDVEKALGSSKKLPSENEIKISKIARKSIVSIRDIIKESFINSDDIAVKRPGYGIPPKYFRKIIGKKVKKTILKDTIITWEDLE